MKRWNVPSFFIFFHIYQKKCIMKSIIKGKEDGRNEYDGINDYYKRN